MSSASSVVCFILDPDQFQISCYNLKRPLDIVLDTNVVLDWLVFRDAAVAGIETALATNRIRVLTCARSSGELRRVLNYPNLALDERRQRETLATYEQVAVCVEVELAMSDAESLAQKLPRCRDADDQYLLTLALCARADALVSRDREVLRLRKCAQPFGINILDVPQFGALLLQQARTRVCNG